LIAPRLSAALADRYRIDRELGQGGMATVYLAQDLRHDRSVAVKVLRPELAAVLGADRFVVEIKTTAALQHPHILPLFDSGSADGFLYYVMPYIQGETLRAKLDRETQLGIDEAVRITREVADALDYAHRHGVIHRDIKPENILLHDGRPMVADFGIALAVSAAAGGRMTETGMSLGTPHYMSPEQATADKEISARSDVYSLASVLYEMLTGSPPHTGSSAQQIIMKIIAEPVAPVTTLRKSVPPHVAAALAMALEKLPADRFDSARAFAAALANPGFTFGTSAVATARAPERDWRRRIAIPALAAAGLLAIAAVWLALQRPVSPPGPVTRYRVALLPGRGLAGTPWTRLAVSPDGSRLVYVGDSERGTQLFQRTRDQLDAGPVPGTEGAINPSFAPDGNRVAFMDRIAGGNIKVVSLSGGAVTTLTDSLVGAPGVAWGSDGYIYYDRLGVGPLLRVRETGGKAETVGQLDSVRGELQHSWPDVLPNGKGVIFTVSHHGPGSMGGPEEEIGVLDLATRTHRVLLRGIFARYAASGHLVYITSEGTLMAVPFDQDRMEVAGEPVALGDGIGVRTGGGAVDLALSASGTLWYAAGGVGSAGTGEAVWVTREGQATPIPGVTGLLSDPALSRDGKRLAIGVRELASHIMIKELDQGPVSRLTTGSSNNWRAAWMADGRSIGYVSQAIAPRSNRDAYQRPADGSRAPTLLLDLEENVDRVVFSRDGAWVVYQIVRSPGLRDLFARRLGSDSSIPLVASRADEKAPALSPDGRWLAYVSNESGVSEVYVRPFPNTADGRWQISISGGAEPVWANSGRELFYRSIGLATDSQMVIAVTTGKSFIPGARKALFPLIRYATDDTYQHYDVAPGDRRFVMLRATEANRADQLIVVDNFFEVLRMQVGRP
jgi:Tol biopolymer transport system component